MTTDLMRADRTGLLPESAQEGTSRRARARPAGEKKETEVPPFRAERSRAMRSGVRGSIPHFCGARASKEVCNCAHVSL